MQRASACKWRHKKSLPQDRIGQSQNYEKKLLFLLRELFFGGNDGDIAAVFATFVELDDAVDKSEESVVLTHTNVLTGVVGGTALANDDVAGDAFLTTKDFDA